MPSLSRRQILRTVGVGGVVAGAGCVGGVLSGTGSGASLPAGSWPQYKHDAANTGANPDSPAPKSPGGIRWEATVPAEVTTPPVIAGETVVVGDEAGTIHALRIADGSTQWTHASKASDGPVHSVGIATDTVVAGTKSGVVAVRTSDGTEVWRQPFDASRKSRVTVADDGVFVTAERGTSRLYALSRRDGSIRWTHDGGQYVPAVHDGTVFVGGSTSFTALDAHTGAQEWFFDAYPGPYRTPVVAGDTVYVGVGSLIVAVSRRTGGERWTDDAAHALTHSPAVADGTIFAAGPSGALAAFDVADGTVDWSTSLPQDATPGAPTVVADTMLVRNGGSIQAHSIRDGTARWSVAFDGGPARRPASLAVAGRTIFTFDNQGTAGHRVLAIR